MSIWPIPFLYVVLCVTLAREPAMPGELCNQSALALIIISAD